MGTGVTAEHVLEDAFSLSIQLRDYQGLLELDGHELPTLVQPRGHVTVYDLRRRWRGNLDMPFDCMNYYLPRAALEELLEGDMKGTLDDLRIGPGKVVEDPVIYALSQALLPAFLKPREANALFLEHMGWALGVHVVRVYGDVSPLRQIAPGGLASWQERRAKEMIDANLTGEVRLADIAAECGISTSHLTRAFRQSTGLPPHQWLLQRRVEMAKTLLLDARISVAEIATTCGFADQSHLTRVFTRSVGVAPGAWRRANIF